jgi:integrase/recombinase XerC
MPAPAWAGQRLPRYLTQPETQALFAAISSLRDRALFSLIYHHGLRVGEVALIARGDVDLVRGRILVRRLKGGRWSEQPLFRSTQKILEEWLASASEMALEAPLFLGRGGPLGRRQIQSLFGQYRDRASLARHYTCHSLRHAIATHLLDAGMSLEFIQDHLGHQDIRSTTIYARITDRRRAEVFRQLEHSPWIVQPNDPLVPDPLDSNIAPAA